MTKRSTSDIFVALAMEEQQCLLLPTKNHNILKQDPILEMHPSQLGPAEGIEIKEQRLRVSIELLQTCLKSEHPD